VEIAERTPGHPGAVALELTGIDAEDRLTSLDGLSLTIRRGEVIGLAGLEGSGQRTLLRTCAGLIAPSAGTIRLGETDLTSGGYQERRDAGIHYVPAGRLEEGLIRGVTITEHFLLCGTQKGAVIDWSQARSAAEAKIGEHSIVGTTESTAESLSGGNQQRLLLAMMPDDIEVLLMEHPTRGLDIASGDWVWTKLLQRVARGAAIVFSSADLDELLRYSDRIVVFFAGRVFKILEARETSPDRLAHLIGGRDQP
jgi:simple sugar transport system ATP-binding protein